MIAVISITDNGDKIAQKISKYCAIHIYKRRDVKKNGIKIITKEAFQKYRGIIYISATGIAIRSIAPFLKNKKVDPAVILIDNSGKYVISLVSGHLGGANELALKIANIIGAEPVITTATDNLGIKAPDKIAQDNDLIIDDFKICKDIASLLVHGKKVLFIDEDEVIRLPHGYADNYSKDIQGVVLITNKKYINNVLIKRFEKAHNHISIPILKLIKKNIVLGIGCKKDYDSNKMIENVLEKLEKYNLDNRSVNIITTVEIKKNEKAIIDLANYLKCAIKFFTIDEIKKVQHNYEGSDFVEEKIGVRGVCEPCVGLTKADLLTDKIKCTGMTMCIGKNKV